MRARFRVLVICVFVFTGIFASAQLTVDATVPIHERRRQPTRGHAGSSGRRLPLQVAIGTNGSPPDEKGKTLVTFVISNSGKDDIEVPVSPHPGDFEPEDSKASHTVKMLSLYLTVDHGEGADRRRAMIPDSAHLYGNNAFPGTIVLLAPGESIHVLARLTLPTDAEVKEGGAIVARVSLNDETIRTVGGQTSSDRQEIGSADSVDYTLQSLLMPHGENTK
jgi:hypothetical protein